VLAGGTVGAWLYRVATRASIDRLRRNRRCRPREEQEEFDTNEQNLEVDRDDPLNQLMRDERIASIRSALALLKPEKAQILLLRHSGLSYLEIAVVMQISAGSVGTMLARAEANFSALYQRQQERGRREPRLQPAKEGR
jgi:RNA polymerase sigma-70 factor (ECF subfamily)